MNEFLTNELTAAKVRLVSPRVGMVYKLFKLNFGIS